jgi:L-fucose isomerase-like protein
MSRSHELEAHLRTEIESNEPVDKEEIINSVSNEAIEQERIMRALRSLMEEDKISFTIDWNLQTEENIHKDDRERL